MSNFHFKRASARGLAVSTVSLACLTTAAMAQEAANTSQPSPDLPPVEVPQPAPAAAPKPKKPKPALAKAKPKPPTPAPAPEVAAAPEPEAADPATALGTYNPALDVRDLELPPGTTLTTAGPVDGYRALTAISSTKTATPIERIPQSIQVVPRELITDQTSIGVDETLRNVSGIQGTNRLQTPAYDSTKVRGFDAEQWLDGLTVYYNAGDRDTLANVERIEVLKGPSAILYGGGAGAPVGGAVNVISKLPTALQGGEFGVTVGSDNFVRPWFDINQPIAADGTVLFRVTGEYVKADSFIDVLETERYSINPTLTFTNKTDTTLTIQGRATRWEQQEYQGLPATGTVAAAFRIDPNLFIGPADIPDSVSEVQAVTVTLDHKFNEYFSGNVKARVSQSDFVERVQTIVGADGFAANQPLFGSTWALSNALLSQEQDEFTINPNLIARFSTETTDNTLLVGGDFSRVSDSGFLTADSFLGGAGTVDLANPSFPTPYVEVPRGPLTSFIDGDNVYTTKGAYVQLQSTLYDRVHVLAGLRLANVTIENGDLISGVTQVADETKLLPRIGAVFDLVDGLSPYASYSEGLRGAPFSFFAPGTRIRPEESKQREVGLKFDVGGGLTGTAAYFMIERENVPIGFPAAPNGAEESKGFEIDTLWQPNRNWKFIANYAFIDAEYVVAAGGALPGNALEGVPEHSGRFWAHYRFDEDVLKGWSVGAGVYAAGEQFVDPANLFKADAYFTVDAQVAYENEQYAASINVKNLTGEDAFVPYSYFGGRVAPLEERAVFGTVRYKY
jgi:iron complex outermembrane receptor protein